MSPVYQNIRLVRGAHWLIRLRWLAIIAVVGVNVVAGSVLNVQVATKAIYAIAVLLVFYNALMLLWMSYITRHDAENNRHIEILIDAQIAIDLILLAFLLHFSGGIENPFSFFFVFHMAIASILLSVRESYLHATLAILLFGFMVVLEEKGLIPHYCLAGGGAGHFPYQGAVHVLGTMIALGTTLYLVVYMTSFVTVRLRYREQAYRKANIQLKHKDRVKDEYVARVTHDIKGDLTAIQSCLDVVDKKMVGSLNDRQEEFVGRALNRTRKLAGFVRSLLKLTQMRLSHNLEMEVFSLDETIAAAIVSVSSQAEEKSISLKNSVTCREMSVKGNRFSIEELVTNLLLNAIKYTPDNGTVEIDAKNSGVYTEVSIRDSGIGIPGGEIGHIFDEFYRGSNAKANAPDGTGLGLSIAKQIVERHGGRIWAASTIGEGTTMSFTLYRADG